MSDQGHDFLSEFPADREVLHALKTDDAEFRRMSGRYHELNKEIHRIEVGIEASSDERVEELKKERLALLDDVAALIAAAKAA